MRVLVSQVASIPGDCRRNLLILTDKINTALSHQCSLLVLPELFSVGGHGPHLSDDRVWLDAEKFNLAAKELAEKHAAKLTVILGSVMELSSGRQLHRQNVIGVFGQGHYAWIPKSSLAYMPGHDPRCYFQLDDFCTNQPMAVRVSDMYHQSVAVVFLDDLLVRSDLSNMPCLSRLRTVMSPAWFSPFPFPSPVIVLGDVPFALTLDYELKSVLESWVVNWGRPVVFVNSSGHTTSRLMAGCSLVSAPQSQPAYWSNSGLPPTSRMARPFVDDDMVVELMDEARDKHYRLFAEEEGYHFEPVLPIKNGYVGERLVAALRLRIAEICKSAQREKAVLPYAGAISDMVLARLARDALGPWKVTVVPMGYEMPDSERECFLKSEIYVRNQDIGGIRQLVTKQFASAAQQTLEGALADIVELASLQVEWIAIAEQLEAVMLSPATHRSGRIRSCNFPAVLANLSASQIGDIATALNSDGVFKVEEIERLRQNPGAHFIGDDACALKITVEQAYSR